MSGQIFIGYRRDDASYPAGRLYDRLTAHFPQNQIFIDVDNLDPGVDFVEVIEASVGFCDILIAVIGKRWLISCDEEGKRRLDNPDDFVRLEIATALRRNIRVIPVLVDGASMPRSTDLPDDLKLLVRRNALEVSHNRFNADLGRLVAAIEKALEKADEERKQPDEKGRLEAERLKREEKERLKTERRENEEKQRLEAQRRKVAESEQLDASSRLPSMKRYFTHYWENKTWVVQAGGVKARPYAASDIFRERGISKGDSLYIVTVKKGQLLLLTRLTVAEVCGIEEAARFLKMKTEDLRKAKDYIVAESAGPVRRTFEVPVPLAITQQLRFVSYPQNKSLRFVKPGILDQQTLRGVRQLDPESAQLLDKFLSNVRSDHGRRAAP